MTKASFELGAKVIRWKEALDNPSKALKQIGVLMVAESSKAFRAQAHGRDKWRARAPVNVFGIIADFSQGGKPKARRFETRPALRDTGRLAASISYRAGTHLVIVGSNLSYAGVQHHGGTTESEAITSGVQKALWKWLKSEKGESYKDKLGFLLNRKFTGEKLTMEVPARPFVGITRKTREDVQSAVGVMIFEV